MNTHSIRLHPEPFLKIQNNLKVTESRLNDEKRQNFSVGDTLIFVNRDDATEINARITKLHHFPTFIEMFNSLPLEDFGGGSIPELLEEIEQFYSQDDQEKWDVVGIEFIKA